MKLTYKLLASYPPFDRLSPEHLAKIYEKVTLKQFEKGAFIFKRGKALCETLYLVSGQIDLVDANFEVTSICSDETLYTEPLNSRAPTAASAVAKSAVVLLVVESRYLDLIADLQQQVVSGAVVVEEDIEDNDDWMSNFLRAPIFNKIPPGNIKQLFAYFARRTFKAGDVIIKEGERGEHFYVLTAGQAVVIDVQGQTIAQLEAGDYFGEEALVGETTRNATVRMQTHGALMCLDKSAFVTLLQEPVRKYISYDELIKKMQSDKSYQIVDVRLSLERRFQAVPESRNIPLSQLRKNLPHLNPSDVYVVTDDAGPRADVAAQLLNQAGFEAYILQDASLHQA